MLEISLISLAATSSAIAAVLALVRFWRPQKTNGRLAEVLLGAAIIFAILGLISAAPTGGEVRLSLRGLLLIAAIAVGGVHLAIIPRVDRKAVGLLCLPVVSVLLIIAAIVGSAPMGQHSFARLYFYAHTTPLLGAYGAFFIAAFSSIAYLTQERAIKRGHIGGIHSKLPSLAMLETISYRAIAIAFPLLTLGTIIGSIWASQVWGAFWNSDPKLTATLLLWLFSAVLFHLRAIEKFKGHRIAILCALYAPAVIAVLFVQGGARHVFL